MDDATLVLGVTSVMKTSFLRGGAANFKLFLMNPSDYLADLMYNSLYMNSPRQSVIEINAKALIRKEWRKLELRLVDSKNVMGLMDD